MIKPGRKTSEFFATVATFVIVPLVKHYIPAIPESVLLGLIGLTGTYTVSRGMAKRGVKGS